MERLGGWTSLSLFLCLSFVLLIIHLAVGHTYKHASKTCFDWMMMTTMIMIMATVGLR